MSIVDLMYEADIKLGELLALFLQGNDDKVYIYLYNGSDDIIFSDIRIIDTRLNEFIDRKVIGLEMGKTLGVYIEKIPRDIIPMKTMKCKKGYEIKLMKSAAGYYLGTVDKEGFPNCRISTQYAATREEAENLVPDRQSNCTENEFCNEGRGCFLAD